MSGSIASDDVPLNETKDLQPDIQDLLKYELAKLHKDFRSLENNRHGFAHKKGGIRVRTNNLLPLLEKDRKDLKYELRIASSPVHSRQVGVFTKSMRELLQSYEVYNEETAKTIKQIKEIERHVDKIMERVVKQQYEFIASHGPSTSLAYKEKKLMIAEDKLYHYTCAFNLQIHENKNMRVEINDLLRGRDRFFKNHNVLKRHLAQTKKKMLMIVQLAMQTYNSRDEAMSKLKTLREREGKEERLHDLDLQEFQRTLHHDSSILGFIKTKLKKRPMIEDAKERRIRLAKEKERELDSILKRYRVSFGRIMQYSKTRSIDDLVDRYRKLDTNNYEAFKFITNLSSECDVLREAVGIIKFQIETAHQEVESRKEEQRKAQERLQLAVISHQEHLFQLQQQSRRNDRRIKDIENSLDKAMIESQCNKGPISQLLGNKRVPDRHNIGLYLSLLDFKITEIKHEIDYLQTEKKNAASNVHYKNAGYQKPKLHPSQGGPYVPKMHMYNVDSMDDDDDHLLEKEPYYYKEMKEFLFNKMVEEGVIDTSARTISERLSAELHPHPEKKEQSLHRKTLTQRVQSEGRRTRHTEHFSEHISLRSRKSIAPDPGLAKKSVDDHLDAGFHTPAFHDYEIQTKPEHSEDEHGGEEEE